MEKNLYLRWFLDFASIYPAAVLCFAPVLKLMKKPIRTILICFIGITFVCLGSAVCDFPCRQMDCCCQLQIFPLCFILSCFGSKFLFQKQPFYF